MSTYHLVAPPPHGSTNDRHPPDSPLPATAMANGHVIDLEIDRESNLAIATWFVRGTVTCRVTG